MPHTDIFSEQSVMGWGNRGWVEIVEMILEVCEKGALKTHIMYRCNLNSNQIAQYLQFLQSHKLIEGFKSNPASKRSIFKKTQMGEKYMNAYRQLEDIFRKS